MNQENNQNKKEYKFYLPDDNGNAMEQATETNSIIIIGGNGAGKSRLGAWIEEEIGENCHRVGGQRSLKYNPNLTLKPLESSRNMLEYGNEKANENPFYFKKEKKHRWLSEPTNFLLHDFDITLSTFIALENVEAKNKLKEIKKASDEKCVNIVRNYISPTDKLQQVWKKVFTHRKIIAENDQFFCQKEEESRYSATEMSDGERAVLYLIAQVLSLREGKTIIIDEPELHLHPSIMNKLWLALEEYRPDCLFIYITHDIEFASLHQDSKKIWVKSFNIENNVKKWDYEELKYQNDFPEDLLLEILGGRKNVLFVEGEKQSYDTQLYQKLYSEFFIIPCGGCEKVIERVKALNEIEIFNKTYKAYGIIDRDFRTENELQCLKEKNIFALNVAEVENLFLLEDVFLWFARKYADDKDSNELFSKFKNFVIETKYKNLKNNQIQQSIKNELEFHLKKIDLDIEKNIDEEKLKNKILSHVEKIDCEKIIKEVLDKFETNDYYEILKVFNHKGLLIDIDEIFGWKKDYQYAKKILHNLNTDDDLRKIFLKNMPFKIESVEE
ncbi:ABC transporter ATP-binding protein [Helicobacter anseris]|uniref:ABC transporter ATP-binding protein n=1 Tax=Helicobacter anseris TaxID=375926 RepID=A0A3D8JC93_9HELI|nr:DUF4435 domain-containing protein [Helicobacter anseris]RDU74531.1 ABC transporter ATP-binding protein [Helicobacter anseris]